MGYWLGIVFSCLDVLCVAVFCDAFLERKTRGLRFVVGALLCGVLSYIATIFVSHISEESPITLLKFAALITVYFVFASLFYLGKFWMRLLVVLLAYAIFTLLEFCVLYSLLALLHIHYDEYVSNMVLYFTGVTITYSLKFLLSSAIKRIHRPVVASSGNTKWAPLTIGFPLISLVGITQSSVNSQTPSTPTNPITAKDLLITEYDDMLTARIIEKIIVKSRQDLEIIFIGGYTQQISLQ